MDAKELRIGNLVDLFGNIATIQSADFSGTGIAIKQGKPIPLTEEWLVKFGFDKKGYKDGLSIILENKLGYKNGRTYFKSWCILESQPKYAHSLQNLYFALTGQELEISE